MVTAKRQRFGWNLLAWAIAVPVLLPVAVVCSRWWLPASDTWAHLLDYVLPPVLLNTLWLVLGVAVLAAILGTSLGWLTASHRFPGQRWLRWALLLPMAIPGYVMAFVMIAVLDYSGPLQTQWRELTGLQGAWPAIRSVGGATFTLALCLYPYVYLVARQAFLSQGPQLAEAAQSLGMSRRQTFWRVSLPLAAPWIVGGVLLALMETLADFGTVATFNVDTLTTAIYRAWFDLQDLDGAMQLASVLVVMALLLMLLEQLSKRRARYHSHAQHAQLRELSGWRAGLACGYCLLVLLLGFVLPCLQLLYWAVEGAAVDLDSRYWGYIVRTAGVAGMAAVLITMTAVLLVYAKRLAGSSYWQQLTQRLALLGYALPGSLVAVGLMVPLALISRQLHGIGWPLVLHGSLFALLLGYGIRFLAVAHNPIDKAMLRISPSIDEAARSLGAGAARLLLHIHVPILKSGLLTALVLVFVDVMKEMPISLLLRPYGWDTLAIRVYEMTAEGEWERAALPAIAIVLVGLLPVALLIRRMDRAT